MYIQSGDEPETASRRGAELSTLVSPVGVFDGGIGSFDLVRRLREAYPDQDVIYLADRASFPYGTRGESGLLDSVTGAARTLTNLGASSIVLASNAPSVTVLDRLRPRFDLPVLGITPPIRTALDALPSDGVLVVAGASVMVESDALHRLIGAEAGDDASRVATVVADSLISLVENGAFLHHERVQEPITEFIAGLRARYPLLAGLTLSSTHLPWLAPVLAESAPDLMLFDPADRVVAEFSAHTTMGSGRLVCLATQSPEHPLEEFEAMVSGLGIALSPILIEIPGSDEASDSLDRR